MKIKEIEAIAGIDRATIYYYEKEKLLSPHRTENGYREYDEEDLITLKRIKLLRSLHLPLDDIRSLMKGKKKLRETLSMQIDHLDKESEDMAYAKEMCRTIYKETPVFTDLDASKYLDQIIVKSEEKGSKYFKVQDELPQVFDFRIRFVARLFDMTIYGLIWNSFRTFLLHQNVLKVYSSFDYLIMLMITLLMTLLMEPILLSLFRTTPGKALYGITIENQDGNRLSLEESFARTWGVLSKGFAFGIIPISVITLGISRTRCENGQIQPWDENISYKIRDYKYYRNIIVFLSFIFLLSANVLLSVVYYSPPNKGDLTVEEFVENFNHYREVYEIDLGEYTLKSSSAWDSPYDYRTNYLPTHLRNAPNFSYSLKNGIVTAVSFWLEVEDTQFWIDSYSNYMTLTALALTEPESIFDSALNADKIIDPIQWEPFKSYELNEMGVTIINVVEYEGFEDNYDHMRPEHSDLENNDNYYNQKFTVKRQQYIK